MTRLVIINCPKIFKPYKNLSFEVPLANDPKATDTKNAKPIKYKK
jgi:hypothetical protein